MIRIKNQNITQRLEDIRERVGGVKSRFFRPVDAEVRGHEVKALVHPTRFLLKNGKPILIYIRDHSRVPKGGNTNRIHFAECETIVQMTAAGRRTRYHVTNREDNQYVVEYADGSVEEIRLHPCFHCLQILYPSYSRDALLEEKESFDAKDTYALVGEEVDIFRLQAGELRGEHVPTGYTWGHRKFSIAYRYFKGHTCDACGVKTVLTDMHHKDNNKHNNKFGNLQCLCKLCHQATHASTHHYPVKSAHAADIYKARKEQGIEP